MNIKTVMDFIKKQNGNSVFVITHWRNEQFIIGILTLPVDMITVLHVYGYHANVYYRDKLIWHFDDCKKYNKDDRYNVIQARIKEYNGS